MISGWLNDPLVQSAALPLAAALIAAGLVRLLGGPGRGAALAGIAIPLAFLAAYVAILGWPTFPPRGSAQKIPWIALGGLALGAVLDLARPPRPLAAVVAALAAAAAALWIGEPLLARLGWNDSTLGLALAAGAAGLSVLLIGRRGDGAAANVVLIVASLGLAAIALLGAAASTAQLAGAMAAAAGGFLLWNWPRQRLAFGAAALLGGVGTLAAMGTQLALFTRASGPALAVLILTALAPLAAARMHPPVGKVAAALAPIVLGLVALVPAVVAGAVAYVAANGLRLR